MKTNRDLLETNENSVWGTTLFIYTLDLLVEIQRDRYPHEDVKQVYKLVGSYKILPPKYQDGT